MGAEVTITETEAPAGYALMSPNPDKVTLPSMPTETGVFEYTLTDKKGGVGLKIIKKDADDATKSLRGAEFKIEYTDAGTPKTLTGTTGADGSLSFMGLPLGAQVIITETNPSAGYELMSSNPVTKTLPTTPGETGVVEYTFTDQKNPNAPDVQKLSLRVIKVDNGTSVPLKGFTFELYKGASLITSGTTDNNGEIIFTDLEPGDYRVREAGGTEDYAVDAPDQFVTLVKDQSEIPTLTFRNDKKRDYRIKKVDAETGAAIPGVVFEIFRDGQSLGQLPPTDANGEVQLEHTEFGTYNVKEVTVPPEYVKSDETFVMEIDKNSQDPFVFTIPNKHKKKLTLKKVDEETGEPMSGVTFDIYLNNNKIDSKTTENGEIVIENAEPGTYRFEEVRTLTGYEPLRDPINIEMTADEDVIVTAKNHKRHDLIIYKRDATTHALLDGVTFQIYKDGKLLNEYTTANGGKIVIENAEPGTYRVVEKSTLKEYILNEEHPVVEHTIEKDTTVYIDNTHRPGLGIDKRDSVTNQPLANVQFRIAYSPDQTPSTDGGNVKTLGDFFTDANGKINLSTETGYNLDEGWYSVTEVKAPAGYIIQEPATQTVHLADGEYKELSFFNQPKSALVIWKYDARTHEALPGVKFEVRKLEGTGTSGIAIPGSPFTTGTNGSATVTDLEPGTYIVQEIDSPLGYVKDPTPQTVSIGADEFVP